MNVLSHFPNNIFPSEVISYAVSYLLKVAFFFFLIRIFSMVSFLKVAKYLLPGNVIVSVLKATKINIF